MTQSDAASYEVAVIGYTIVTSSPPAVVTVVPFDPSQLPTITTQPLSRTNYQGVTANFSVSVSGTGPFGCQWRKNGVELRDGATVVGSITPNLTLLNTSTLDQGTYDVVVLGYTNAISDPATLTVLPFTGTLLLYEPFDYTNAGGLVTVDTPNNWVTGGSGGNDTGVAAGNLFYGGLAVPIGNSLTNGGAGLAVRRLLPTGISSGVVYFSALFRINEFSTNWNQSGTQVGALTAADNVSFRLQVIVKGTSATGYSFGVEKGGSGAAIIYDTATYHIGDTVFLVGKYDFTTTPNSASLWINPDSSYFGSPTPAPTGYIVSSTGTDNLVIDRFNFRQNTATTLPANMQWDELRVGLSWADVTPTPF